MYITENKAIARTFYEGAWNAGGDLSIIDTLLATDFLNHELEGKTTQSHRELYKQGILETFQAFPDWTTTIDELIAEDEKVVIQWHAQGTHTGDGRSIASGKHVRLHGITIVRVVAGKITEFWKKDDSFAVWHAMQS